MSSARKKYKSNFEELRILLNYPKPILSEIISKKILQRNEIRENLDVFGYYNVIIDNNLIEEPKKSIEDDYFPEGYFQIGIQSYPNSRKPIIEDIQKSFKIIVKEDEHFVLVSLDQIAEFVEKYKDLKVLNWYRVCSDTRIPWTNDLVINLKEKGYWHTLHTNSSIKWNFDLIENIKDFINWSFISSYKEIKWTIDTLTQYKDYLIFSIKYDRRWKRGYNNNSKKSSSVIEPGNSFKDEIYKDLAGSISLSKTLDWNKEIIDCLIDYWDWEELSSNESIPWDDDMIEYYSKRIDFKYLSSNTSVKWNENLIERYRTRWDWEELSGNPSLPWSQSFLEKHERKWQWKVIKYQYLIYETEFEPSISTNPGINWDVEMITKWEKNIDFWRLARQSKISDSILKKFHSKFDEKRIVEFKYHKFSDWRYDEDIFGTGWENLALNNQFTLNKKNIEFLYKNKISLTYSVGNLADFDGYYETKDFRLLEILKNNPIEKYSLQYLAKCNHRWVKIFLNENFINDSLLENSPYPIFNKEYAIKYINLLRRKIKSSSKNRS